MAAITISFEPTPGSVRLVVLNVEHIMYALGEVGGVTIQMLPPSQPMHIVYEDPEQATLVVERIGHALATVHQERSE